jgi:hypothetical protein
MLEKSVLHQAERIARRPRPRLSLGTDSSTESLFSRHLLGFARHSGQV